MSPAKSMTTQTLTQPALELSRRTFLQGAGLVAVAGLSAGCAGAGPAIGGKVAGGATALTSSEWLSMFSAAIGADVVSKALYQDDQWNPVWRRWRNPTRAAVEESRQTRHYKTVYGIPDTRSDGLFFPGTCMVALTAFQEDNFGGEVLFVQRSGAGVFLPWWARQCLDALVRDTEREGTDDKGHAPRAAAHALHSPAGGRRQVRDLAGRDLPVAESQGGGRIDRLVPLLEGRGGFGAGDAVSPELPELPERSGPVHAPHCPADSRARNLVGRRPRASGVPDRQPARTRVLRPLALAA